jgi:hypothetical protein
MPPYFMISLCGILCELFEPPGASDDRLSENRSKACHTFVEDICNNI